MLLYIVLDVEEVYCRKSADSFISQNLHHLAAVCNVVK